MGVTVQGEHDGPEEGRSDPDAHLRGRTLLIRKLGRPDPTNDAEKGTAPT